MGQLAAPYVRIPIHGTYIDCGSHILDSTIRTGKSIAWEFTDRLLEKLNISLGLLYGRFRCKADRNNRQATRLRRQRATNR